MRVSEDGQVTRRDSFEVETSVGRSAKPAAGSSDRDQNEAGGPG